MDLRDVCRVLHVRLDRRHEDAGVDVDEVKADEGDLHLGVDHDPLVENPVEDLDRARSRCGTLNRHAGGSLQSKCRLDLERDAGDNRAMRAPTWLIAVVLVVTSGCAAHVSDLDEARTMSPCLPAAVSAQFFFWPVVAFRSVSLLTEDGVPEPASWVLYRKGKAAVAAMWVHSDLIAVDPSPETDAPEWVDLSLVVPIDGKLVLRDDPEAPCRWGRWDNDASTSLDVSKRALP
jgi:hypothetical protein